MSEELSRGRNGGERIFETDVSEGVLRVSRPGTRWLSTGANGGYVESPAAYNITVPTDWKKRDLDSYIRTRRLEAGFDDDGPALLTGVSMDHARVAQAPPAAVVATAGLSNPAGFADGDSATSTAPVADQRHDGTVNVLACVERTLAPGALANLVAVIAEAKTAALLETTGFPGTTTDAVIAGCDPTGREAEFSGSATPVGAATRACVYDAVRACITERYEDGDLPETVHEADYGVVTDVDTAVFAPVARKGQTD